MKAKPQQPNTHQLRTIIEEVSVQALIDKAAGKYPRIGEIFRGLTWRMSREPESGHVVPRYNPSVSLIKIDPDINLQLPGITALYTYNDDEVNILAVRIVEPPVIPIRKKPAK